MCNTVIKVENLSKQYRLGLVGASTFKEDAHRWWAKMRGKEDPFLSLGEENDRTQTADSRFVWSLRDINFEVEQGDVLGIIGRNGAGKSTLLKILSKITAPTTGSVKAKGRIASLLEVGTGFHPELTGRENIFLNGAILGMRKHEIKRKLDEIIAFAGVERYIDTPVKRYSSGMYVRLAFAVAAHLESEILILDEVLAVGDAEFQKKCLGKIGELSNSEGRTVLFVSHNMLALKSLCNKGVLLKNGKLDSTGDIKSILQKYSSQNSLKSENFIGHKTNNYFIKNIQMSDNGTSGFFNIDNEVIFKIEIDFFKKADFININLFFNTTDGSTIFVTCSEAIPVNESTTYLYTCFIPKNILNDNVYSIDLMLVENKERVTSLIKEVLTIEGVESKREGAWLEKFPGLIRPTNFQWQIIKL
jgi:lipopolysaccharide transport system ATP-binding protein